MIYATKVKMKYGSRYSNNLMEIDEIFLDGEGNCSYFKKGVIHDFLKDHPGAVRVNISPYPEVIPAVSVNREKYVKSTPNSHGRDNLLSLPRE